MKRTEQGTTAPLNGAALVTAIHQLKEDDLKMIYRNVKERLRVAHLLTADNLNVISVRLPHDTCDRIRKEALLRGGTVSEVVRDAILDYCDEGN